MRVGDLVDTRNPARRCSAADPEASVDERLDPGDDARRHGIALVAVAMDASDRSGRIEHARLIQPGRQRDGRSELRHVADRSVLGTRPPARDGAVPASRATVKVADRELDPSTGTMTIRGKPVARSIWGGKALSWAKDRAA